MEYSCFPNKLQQEKELLQVINEMEYYAIKFSQRKHGLNFINTSVLKGRFLNPEGYLTSRMIQIVIVPESTFLYVIQVFWSGKWEEFLIN